MFRDKISDLEKKYPLFMKFSCIIKKFIKDDISGLSAELTFYLITSFFPFVIVLLALISVTPLSAEETLFPLLSALPKEVYNIVLYVLTGVERSTLIIALSGVIAMWSVSCAVATINKALNRMYNRTDKRNIFIIRSLGFMYALILAIAIVLTFSLLVFGNIIGMAIMKFIPEFFYIWGILRHLLAYSLLFAIFATLYKIIPDVKLNYSSVVFGSAFTTIMWGIASVVFSFYVDNFSKYHIIYGSLNGIVILFTWLYMTSFILLTGGEINSIIYNNKKGDLN